MTFRDQESWDIGLETNKNSAFGMAIFRYAERWATLVEDLMAKGIPLAKCADQISDMIEDEEKLSGWMQNDAMVILKAVWIHGDKLRDWQVARDEANQKDWEERLRRAGGDASKVLFDSRFRGEK